MPTETEEIMLDGVAHRVVARGPMYSKPDKAGVRRVLGTFVKVERT